MSVEAILLLVAGGLLASSALLAVLGALLRARSERRSAAAVGRTARATAPTIDPLLLALQGPGGGLDGGDVVPRARASVPGEGPATAGDGAPTWVSRLDASPDGRPTPTTVASGARSGPRRR